MPKKASRNGHKEIPDAVWDGAVAASIRKNRSALKDLADR